MSLGSVPNLGWKPPWGGGRLQAPRRFSEANPRQRAVSTHKYFHVQCNLVDHSDVYCFFTLLHYETTKGLFRALHGCYTSQKPSPTQRAPRGSQCPSFPLFQTLTGQ